MKTTDKNIYQYLLATDGVNQLERSALSLDPSLVKIDGRSKHDILRFLHALSRQIRFFDLNNQPMGDWQPFLDVLAASGNVPDETTLTRLLLSRKDWSPHITLLIAFLQVYAHAQNDLNQLPASRLNFYYEDVLRLQRRSAIADQVHVLVELAKSAAPTLLTKGTLLKGGKTANGLPLDYALDSDHVFNHATISGLMSSFADVNPGGQRIIFKTGDATLMRENSTSWRPFGTPQLQKNGTLPPMEHADIGFALASPNFFLAEGIRVINITMRLKSREELPDDIALTNLLDVKMTGLEGWIIPDVVQKITLTPVAPTLPDPKEFEAVLDVSVLYNESSPAITAYDEVIHQARLATEWPACSIRLKPDVFLLEILGQYSVAEVTVGVDVKGVKDLILQNDLSVQAAGTPVLPFTSFPRVDGNFYIGSAEAFRKSITSFAVSLKWQDPPASFGDHYAGYENPNVNNEKFKTDVHLLAGRKWTKLNNLSELLFDHADPAATHQLSIPAPVITQHVPGTPYKRQPKLAPPTAFDQFSQQGFIKLVLIKPTKTELGNLPADAPFEAFGHKTYPTVYSRHAIDKALGVADVILPQQPYTPTLTEVTLDYTAADTFSPDNPNHTDQLFQLDVFGAVEATKGSGLSLIPKHDPEAALYIGLENAVAPQLLSLLFQLEEGSTPGAELLRSEEISWSYLAGGQWRTISRADVLEDKTDGFQVSGLVRLVIGDDATLNHTLMPDNRLWVRASVLSKANGAGGVQALHTQAARASLQIPPGLEKEYDAHLATLLPAETISSLTKKLVGVKKVQQPYPSFGGRASESDQAYHRRVHERLRHRSRAVSAWDHERLILEAFPEIFKVKCLPHTNEDNLLSPGDVKAVIVPDWRKRSTGNPLKPKANGAFLRSVETFVETTHATPFANVHVTNPEYETLLVDSKVKFKDGFDPGYHSILLEDELKRFLSPWAYEEGQDIVFDGKIPASEILAFIEGRDYVEHVTDFELYHRHKGIAGGGIGEMQIGIDFVVGITPDATIGGEGIGKMIGEDFVIGVPVDIATATRPDAILVSNERHRIGVLSDNGSVCEGTQSIGIGQMVIGLDFIIIT